jgi:hypothetical protein
MKLEILKKIAVSFSSLGALAIVLGGLIFAALITTSPSADGVPVHHVNAIPAFARKYGLPCSACHEAWPKLNNFGQVFRDNGYQLLNDKDAPITRDPSYWPMTFRISPIWHRESTTKVAVDDPGQTCTPGGPCNQTEHRITASGFDLSGLDIWTAGTLFKNISFLVLPSSDVTAKFHFESAWVRFDNLFGSSWLNLKFGKHELDTPISEKRFLILNSTGGIFQVYHFVPVTDINSFGGIGQNQLGIELMGHSRNSYTRYAFSVLSSNGGTTGLTGTTGLPGANTYDFYGNVNQAFELPRLGLQRVGAYAYIGKSPTYFLTSSGTPILGGARGNRGFYRAGAYGIWYLGKFDFSTLYIHGQDNVFLGNNTPSNQPSALPAGAQAPTWNGAFIETHYTYSPQLIFVNRFEMIRMSRQADPSLPSDHGNINAYTIGYRWYPIMHSRAGLAWVQEYSYLTSTKTAPLSGRNVGTSSLLMGFDFDF